MAASWLRTPVVFLLSAIMVLQSSCDSIINPPLAGAQPILVSFLKDQPDGLLANVEMEGLGSMFVFGQAADGVPTHVDQIVYQDERTKRVLRWDFSAEGVLERIVGPSGTIFVDYGTPDENSFTLTDALTGDIIATVPIPALLAEFQAITRLDDPNAKWLTAIGTTNVVIGALGVGLALLALPEVAAATGLAAVVGWAGVGGGVLGGYATALKGMFQIERDQADLTSPKMVALIESHRKLEEAVDKVANVGNLVSLPSSLSNLVVAGSLTLVSRQAPGIISRMEFLEATAGPAINGIAFGLDQVENEDSAPSSANPEPPKILTTTCPDGWVRCACPAAHSGTIPAAQLCRDDVGRVWHPMGFMCP